MRTSIRRTTDEYISQRVKFEVLGYRIKLTESEIRELERSEKEVDAELSALKSDLERAGERIVTERQPYEVSEEMKLVSAQLQKLQDLPEDAERIYKDYIGNIEGLKDKLQQLQENKKLMLLELEERKKAWRDAVQSLIEEITPVYQRVLATVGALGAISLEEGDEHRGDRDCSCSWATRARLPASWTPTRRAAEKGRWPSSPSYSRCRAG